VIQPRLDYFVVVALVPKPLVQLRKLARKKFARKRLVAILFVLSVVAVSAKLLWNETVVAAPVV